MPIIETSEKIVRNQLKNRWMRRADKNNAAYSANAAKGLFQTCRHGLDRPNRSVLPSENAYQVISNRAVHFNHAANIGLPRRPLN